MHTVGNKISARERELAPRYYYKIAESRTCLEKIKAFFRTVLTFMFTQVGVVVLVAAYMVFGALIFESLESESQMEVAEEVLEVSVDRSLCLVHCSMFRCVLSPSPATAVIAPVMDVPALSTCSP